MQIYFKFITGKSIVLEVGASDTIKSVKEKIQEIEGISEEATISMKLIFKGKILEDDKALSEYDIRNEDVLALLWRIRGGCL